MKFVAVNRDELLGVTVLAAHTQKTVLEAGAFKIRHAFLLHVFRERPASCFARRTLIDVRSLVRILRDFAKPGPRTFEHWDNLAEVAVLLGPIHL